MTRSQAASPGKAATPHAGLATDPAAFHDRALSAAFADVLHCVRPHHYERSARVGLPWLPRLIASEPVVGSGELAIFCSGGF